MLVRPKPGILDPQGEAVQRSLEQLGFPVEEARVGRVVDLEVELSDPERTRAELERMCEQLLANPLIESYEITVDRMSAEPGPRIAVVVFPGSNDDRDAVLAFERLGAEAVLVWHADPELPEVGAVVLPGGFSYGDYLRCGAIARFAPVMEAVQRFADDGGLVLGICNGFQVLCEAGLLPGVLRPNESLSFVCRDVALRVERADTPFTSAAEPGQTLTIPIKHGEGCYFADEELLAELESDGQVLLRYEDNPNGSVAGVAGVANRRGQRLRPDAAPRARGRPAARLDRRRADPRLARRRSSRATTHGRRLSPSASASAGRLASPACSRSRSRLRSVTGPRRAVPPVA